jgi:hypothetical protein
MCIFVIVNVFKVAKYKYHISRSTIETVLLDKCGTVRGMISIYIHTLMDIST